MTQIGDPVEPRRIEVVPHEEPVPQPVRVPVRTPARQPDPLEEPVPDRERESA